MWNEEKQHLFDGLREKEYAGTLTDEERQQLDELFAELDREEAELLRPAMERSLLREQALDAEIAQTRARLAALEALAERQAGLRARAEAVLAELRAEQKALQIEYEQTTSESRHAA